MFNGQYKLGASMIEEIQEEANRLINKEFPLLKNDIKDYMVEYVLQALVNLGYQVKKSKTVRNSIE